MKSKHLSKKKVVYPSKTLKDIINPVFIRRINIKAVACRTQNGYICVKTQTDESGNICGFSEVQKDYDKSNSIYLFFAGGANVDDKVAKANAALL